MQSDNWLEFKSLWLGFSVREGLLSRFRTVASKLVVNYPLGVIWDSSGGNAEPNPQRCSML